MTVDDIFNEILKKRGIEDIEAFLNPSYEDHLHDPMLLPDVQKALKRLTEAKSKNEKIFIYGDYDIDGLTATTLLLDAFESFGIKAGSYIPDRFNEGYGMSKSGIDRINQLGGHLIVTVDCGSRSLEEIEYAKSLEIDVIVTDHHEVGERLPSAVATINPKRPDSKYPWRDLAGVGVAFKLVQAMQTQFEGLEPGQEKWLLDLVALGTVCDVVDMLDENRVLVKWGLEVMKRSRRHGIQALAKSAQVDLSEISTFDLGFKFGPRLNASGRLDHAQQSLDVLIAEDIGSALVLAEQLNVMNFARRSDQKDIYEAAIIQAEKFADDPVLVLADENWSHGINGIVASKLVEKYEKPAFVLQILEDQIKGSARSFGDFHLANAIKAVEEHTISGGGHSFAAGVGLAPGKLEDFRNAINDYYRSLKLSDQSHHLIPSPDVSLDSFDLANLELIDHLEKLAPFGNSHEQPIFRSKTNVLSWKPVGSDQKHAKVTFIDGSNKRLDAIGFNMVELMQQINGEVEIIYHLEANSFNGQTNPQIKLIKILPINP